MNIERDLYMLPQTLELLMAQIKGLTEKQLEDIRLENETRLDSVEAILFQEDGTYSLMQASGRLYHEEESEKAEEKMKSSDEVVAAVSVVGSLQKQASWWYQSTSTVQLAALLQQLDQDDKYGAIILHIESGGGTVSGTYDLGRVIEQVKKPIIAYVSDMAASAAYWFAAKCDAIYLSSPTCMVGSVGVMTVHDDYSAYFEAAGLKRTYLTSRGSHMKKAGNRAEPLSEEAETMIIDRLSKFNEIFVSEVSKSRAKSLTGNKELDTSRMRTSLMFTAKDALSLGLADKIYTFDQAVASTIKLAKKYRKELKKAGASAAQDLPNDSLKSSSSYMDKANFKTANKRTGHLAIPTFGGPLDMSFDDNSELGQSEAHTEVKSAGLDLINHPSETRSLAGDKTNNLEMADQTYLENMLTQATEKVSKLEEKVYDSRISTMQLEFDKKGLESKLELREEKIKLMQEAKEVLETSHKEAVASLQSEIDSLKEQLNASENLDLETTDLVKGLRTEIEELEGKNAKLAEHNKEITTEKSTVDADLDAKSTELDDKVEELKTANERIVTLEGELNEATKGKRGKKKVDDKLKSDDEEEAGIRFSPAQLRANAKRTRLA